MDINKILLDYGGLSDDGWRITTKAIAKAHSLPEETVEKIITRSPLFEDPVYCSHGEGGAVLTERGYYRLVFCGLLEDPLSLCLRSQMILQHPIE